jgi:hypothetical protein
VAVAEVRVLEEMQVVEVQVLQVEAVLFRVELVVPVDWVEAPILQILVQLMVHMFPNLEHFQQIHTIVAEVKAGTMLVTPIPVLQETPAEELKTPPVRIMVLVAAVVMELLLAQEAVVQDIRVLPFFICNILSPLRKIDSVILYL